jgi:hypothetical protein
MTSQSLTWFLDVAEPTLPAAPPVVPADSNYTSTEIAVAVDKLVQGAIRRPYGALGERQTGTTFDDTMDAAAGVFILTPEAPFYVLLLGSRRLSELVTSLLDDSQKLVAAIDATGRRVKPVENLTNLGNARTALAALESASNVRDSVFEDIETTSAFQRFDLHTSRFLDQNAKNIRVGQNIVETPQKARKSLGELVSAVTEGLAEVQRRVGLLAAGIDDYNAMNLPALLARGVISRARGVIDDRITQMEALTPTARLEVLRETVLDVLASKAVVKGFGSLPKSGTFADVDGIAVPFADADHLATPALVSSDLLDPFIIIAGQDTLTFTVEGGPTTVSIPLQRSFLARIQGTIAEPYEIVNSVNDELSIVLDPGNDFVVNLTTGAARTAPQIVADINAAITTQLIVAESFLAPEKFIGIVNMTGTDPNMVFTVSAGTNFFQLSVDVGDAVLITTGVYNQAYFTITAVTTTTISATRSGGSAVAAATNVSISVGPPDRFVRVRVSDGDEAEALEDSMTIEAEANAGDPSAWATLGIFPGSVSQCRRTRAEEVALSINSSASAAVAGVARVAAAAVFVGGGSLAGRSEPTDPFKVMSSVFRALADIIDDGPTPARFAISGAASAGVVVGDRVTLRSAALSSQVGLRGTITLVTDTEIRANMLGLLTVQTGVDLEVGKNLDAQKDQVVVIAAPSPAAGVYRVIEDAQNVTEITLDRPLPNYYTFGSRPLTFSFELGANRVDFQSLSTSTSSRIAVSGNAHDVFFDENPDEAVGGSAFVLLAEDPKTLGFGDRFEIYTGQYDVPEHSFAVIGFEQGQQLIELDGDVPLSFTQLDFSRETPAPFARIRKVARNNYDDFKVQLGLWQVLSVNEQSWTRDLNRFINPLIVNENPTLAATNTAKLHVQTLVQALGQLQTIIAGYEVDTVPRVDTLVDSFLSRGSDRAVDTLLEGRFQDFFGFTSEEMSYLGNALERLREVSRLDLPVRKTQRKEMREQELSMGEFEDANYEFDFSDIQDVVEVDIPGSFLPVPNSNP